MPERRRENPPPLTVAASLVAVQGLVLVALAVVELGHIASETMSLGIAASVFFVVYGGALLVCAWALTRQQGWTRGPVLITQLIQLGLAWNLREYSLVAITLAAAACVVLLGMLHPASIDALAEGREA